MEPLIELNALSIGKNRAIEAIYLTIIAEKRKGFMKIYAGRLLGLRSFNHSFYHNSSIYAFIVFTTLSKSGFELVSLSKARSQ